MANTKCAWRSCIPAKSAFACKKWGAGSELQLMMISKLNHKHALLALGLTALALVTWAFVIEPDRLLVKESRLTLPNWPKPLSGLRIVALADLHIGAPHMDLDKLRQIVALTNAQQPDLILLLGDYVIQGVTGGEFVEPTVTAQELARLKSKVGTSRFWEITINGIVPPASKARLNKMDCACWKMRWPRSR
jgi:hypothetical protein